LTLTLSSIEMTIDDAANVATTGGKGRMMSSHGGMKGRIRR
jgi:hypothetical protein